MVLLLVLDGGALSRLSRWDRVTRLGVLLTLELVVLTAIALWQMFTYLGAVFRLEFQVAALASGRHFSLVG